MPNVIFNMVVLGIYTALCYIEPALNHPSIVEIRLLSLNQSIPPCVLFHIPGKPIAQKCEKLIKHTLIYKNPNPLVFNRSKLRQQCQEKLPSWYICPKALRRKYSSLSCFPCFKSASNRQLTHGMAEATQYGGYVLPPARPFGPATIFPCRLPFAVSCPAFPP